MKRRDFVVLGTLGIAAVSIPGYFYYFKDVEYDSLLAQPRSLSMLWDSQTIQKIGDQYRLQVPDEKEIRSLVKLLAVNASTGEALFSMLEEKIKNDFIAGDTVIVDGWILSVTEARQCALSSTIQLK